MVEKTALYFFIAFILWLLNGIVWTFIHPAILHGYADARKWNIFHFVMNMIILLCIIRGVYLGLHH